jgi:peptide/nickel transport system permease protein
MRLWIYVLRRLLLLVPVIIGVVTITFVIVSALPIPTRLAALYGSPDPHDPWIYSPTQPCPAPNGAQQCYNPTYHFFLNRSGLGEPVPLQWARYVGNIFTFHWGYVSNGSTVGNLFPEAAGQPVTTVLSWFLPYTLELAVVSMAIVLAVAIPLGRISAGNRNRPVDHVARALSFSGFALPSYFIGSLMIILTVILLGTGTGFFAHPPWCPGGETTFDEVIGSWPSFLCYPNAQFPSWLSLGVISHPTGFPTVDAFLNGAPWLGLDSLLRLILPALVIAFAHLGLLLRYVRNSTLEVMNLDYVRTARAEGVSEHQVVTRHAGRNSMTVTVTMLAVSFATFFGWFPIAELLFGLNGVGLIVALAAESGNGGLDFGVITGATLTLTFLVVISNVIADLIVAYLDPRIRLG